MAADPTSFYWGMRDDYVTGDTSILFGAQPEADRHVHHHALAILRHREAWDNPSTLESPPVFANDLFNR